MTHRFCTFGQHVLAYELDQRSDLVSHTEAAGFFSSQKHTHTFANRHTQDVCAYLCLFLSLLPELQKKKHKMSLARRRVCIIAKW